MWPSAPIWVTQRISPHIARNVVTVWQGLKGQWSTRFNCFWRKAKVLLSYFLSSNSFLHCQGVISSWRISAYAVMPRKITHFYEQLKTEWPPQTFESAHEIMVLFVLCKLILQTLMHSHPVGLDVWFLVGPFISSHTSCVQTAKALARLPRCAGLVQLACAFAGHLCDKYNNLMSWIIYLNKATTKKNNVIFFYIFLQILHDLQLNIGTKHW